MSNSSKEKKLVTDVWTLRSFPHYRNSCFIRHYPHGHNTHVTWHWGLLQNVSCLYPVHSTWMAGWQCWNIITSLTLSSVKLSRLCPTIKGSKSLKTLFPARFSNDVHFEPLPSWVRVFCKAWQGSVSFFLSFFVIRFSHKLDPISQFPFVGI
jgi:hypothetical protein